MAEAVTRDMASSHWLKLASVHLFRAQSVSKNKVILFFFFFCLPSNAFPDIGSVGRIEKKKNYKKKS